MAHDPAIPADKQSATCNDDVVTRDVDELVDDPTDGWFPESVARRYDDGGGVEYDPTEIERTVDVLADLAGDGHALELAIGTGRIAVPLAVRGVRVHGIELSQAMARRIDEKLGGDGITVTIGDMSTTRVLGEFSLVFLVFNTINNLTTQDAQVACFENAAAHLRPGGTFVVEVGVPKLRHLPPGQDSVPFTVAPDGHDGGYVGYDQYDVATQRFTSNHVTVDRRQGSFRSIPFRYVWPAELDLMARIAGLRLRHRWADWSRSPFTNDSPKHVSVWEKPAT